MDIEKLIDGLKKTCWGESAHAVDDERRNAANAITALLAENARLRGELEYEREHANAYHEECGQWEAENEKLRAELDEKEKYYDQMIDALAATDSAELEQAKRDFDRLCEYIDSEGFLRKQFCENGNPDFEPCICPSLQEHPGYIDSDDCEGCDHFCNSWHGTKEG